MKKIQFLLTTVLLAMAGNTLADELRVNDFSIEPGETKTISVELNNPDNTYIAFEFFMTLPEGISIAEDVDGYLDVVLNSSRSSRHTLEVEQSSSGSYHFLCYSNRNNALKGTEGEILSITVTADAAMEGGVLQGLLFNQKLSDPDENKVVFDDFSFNITVTSQTPTEVSITIPVEGTTTYCPSYDLDFNEVTGFKAYVATHYNRIKSTIVMQQAVDAPAGTGLFLKGTPGTYTIPINGTKNSYADMLVGTTTNTTIPTTEGKYTNLTFSSNETFIAATSDNTIEANRAWLQLPSTQYNGQTVTIEYDIDGDMNKDGSLTITDVANLVNMILGTQ